MRTLRYLNLSKSRKSNFWAISHILMESAHFVEIPTFYSRVNFLTKCRYFVKMDSKSTNKPLPTEAFERVWRKNHKFHDILHNYPKMIFCAKNLEIHGNPSFHLKSALFRHPLSNASVANDLLILCQTILAKFPFSM